MIAARGFRYFVTLAVAVRILMAAWLPVTGDEAYFFVWAQNLDYGYYDHPPMVAWWLWLLQTVSGDEFVARLPAIAVSLFIAHGIYRFTEPYGVDRARLITLLFLFTPVYLLLPITTTDTPLLLFSFASILAATRAWQANSYFWYAAAGLMLGLAFLSKYFAVLLGLAYLAAIAFTPQGRRRWRGFVVLVLAAMPAVAVNVVWNYLHCWNNILFNLFNRSPDSGFAMEKPLLYLLLHLYLLTPVLAYYAFRRRRALRRRLGESEFLVAGFAAWVPLLVLLAVALRREVGLHWVLAFYPPLFLVLGVTLTVRQLRNAARFMVGFAAVHLFAIVLLLSLPVNTWRGVEAYDEIVFLRKTTEVADTLRRLDGGFEFFTTSYTPSAMLAHRLDRHVGVFGVGSRYARQDDMLTDFRALSGKSFLILVKADVDEKQFAPFFERIERRTFRVEDAVYHFILGHGFLWKPYRDQILETVRKRYYDIPDFLPTGRCGFLERYFTESRIESGRMKRLFGSGDGITAREGIGIQQAELRWMQ